MGWWAGEWCDHMWEKWSEPIKLERTLVKGGSYTADGQQRRCTVCNMIQVRIIAVQTS